MQLCQGVSFEREVNGVNHKECENQSLWQDFMDGVHTEYRGTSLKRNSAPPPQDYHRALGIVLLYGPKGALFLMRKAPLKQGRTYSAREY